MMFKNKFESEYTEMNKNLTTLNSAVKGIRDNIKMKEVFVLVLKVGNYLTLAPIKEQPQGFSMDLLLQLS